MKAIRYRILVVATVLLAVVGAGRPAFAAPGVWPGTHIPMSNCGYGVLESYVDGKVYGWTTNTCVSTPAGAAFTVMTFVGGGYYLGMLVPYGPSNRISHFAIPYIDPTETGGTLGVCFGLNPQRVMDGPTPTRCLELRDVDGQFQSTPLSVTDPRIANARPYPMQPGQPNCSTCLVDGDD